MNFCNCLRSGNKYYIHSLKTEVELIDVLHNSCKYNVDDGNECISKKLDCIYHVDALAHAIWTNSDGMKMLMELKFDIKDVDDKNISTGNYAIDKLEIEFLSASIDIYWLAFRLNDRQSRKLNDYIVVNSQELCSRINSFEDRWKYFLVPLAEIKKCVDKFEVEGDFE